MIYFFMTYISYVILTNFKYHSVFLTDGGLITLYGNKNLSQYWLRQWLVALQNQAFTGINVDVSLMVVCGIHLRPTS